MGARSKQYGSEVERGLARVLGGSRYAGSSSNPGGPGADLKIPHTRLWVDVKSRARNVAPKKHVALFEHFKQWETEHRDGGPLVAVVPGYGVVFRAGDVLELTQRDNYGLLAGTLENRFSVTPLRWLAHISETAPADTAPAVILHLKGLRYADSLVLMSREGWRKWRKLLKADGVPS